MKEIIITIAMIVLGLAIFLIINGTQKGSIRSGLKDVWKTQAEDQQTIYP